MTGLVPIPVSKGMAAFDVIGQMLGRPPTKAELVDLAPVAVMVQAFINGSEPGDQLTFKTETWDRSYLFGAYGTSGHKAEVKVKKKGRK
jgi:hypothetical protein